MLGIRPKLLIMKSGRTGALFWKFSLLVWRGGAGNRIKSERGDGGEWGLALMQVRKDQKGVEDRR